MLPRLVFFPRPTVTLSCASEAWSPASRKWASMPFQDWQDCRGSTGRYGGGVGSGPLSVSWPVPPVSTQPGGRLARAGSTLPSWTPLAGRPVPLDRDGLLAAAGAWAAGPEPGPHPATALASAAVSTRTRTPVPVRDLPALGTGGGSPPDQGRHGGPARPPEVVALAEPRQPGPFALLA